MKEKISDGLMKVSYNRNFDQETGSEGVKQKKNTQYLPPL
jgi:hypothetical protein